MTSEGEELLDLLLRSLLPEFRYAAYQREYRFHRRRRWRFDFAFPSLMLAIEYEGSFHRTKERFAPDMDKYNTAQIEGWVVLRFGRKQLNDGRAEKQIRKALGQEIKFYDKPIKPNERPSWPKPDEPGIYSCRSAAKTNRRQTYASSEKGHREKEGSGKTSSPSSGP